MESHQERTGNLTNKLVVVAVVAIVLVFSLNWALDRPQESEKTPSATHDSRLLAEDGAADRGLTTPQPAELQEDHRIAQVPAEEVEARAEDVDQVVQSDPPDAATISEDSPEDTDEPVESRVAMAPPAEEPSEHKGVPAPKPKSVEEPTAPSGSADASVPAETAGNIAEPPVAIESDPTELPWLEGLAEALTPERLKVNEDVAQYEGKASRDYTLASCGRSSAASGQFDKAAAAYSLFIEEYGYQHEYSERILMKLGECLMPLDMRSTGVMHTPEGPQFQPRWRMNYTPSPEQMRLAIGAYEACAEYASSEAKRAKALFALGWAHRALNDYEAASEAWQRCVDVAGDSRIGADALYRVAENLEWIDQPQAAADELYRFVQLFPLDARAASARKQALLLEAQAQRTEAWFDDPVAGLEAEIAGYGGELTALQAYEDVSRWLQIRFDTQTAIVIGHWACQQTDWPVVKRIVAHNNLADALLAQPEATENDRREAADLFDAVVSLAPSDDWAVPAGLKRARIFCELGDFVTADAVLDAMDARIGDSKRWYPNITLDRVQSLLDRGDAEAAEALLTRFIKEYPDYPLSSQYASLIDNGA